MHVEGETDRHVRPDDLAHAANQLAVGVRPGIGHGGPVLRQQHRVPGTIVADSRDDPVDDVAGRLCGHRPHRG